jgi:hypothetical protein
MQFTNWFKKRNLNEVVGLGNELPEDIQKDIKELAPENNYLYLFMKGNNVSTGNIQMTGKQLKDLQQQLVVKMKDLVEKNKVDPKYQNKEARDKALKARSLNIKLIDFFKNPEFSDNQLFVVKNR